MSTVSTLGDRALDVLHFERESLRAIFSPKSVAVIGATDRLGSVGRTLVWNLISSPFGGIVYPVNPKHKSVLGIRAYPTIASIGERVDLAVIVTPAPSVPDVIGECVEARVKGAIIISAGFKEAGEQGVALEQEVLKRAHGRMRVLGPNCLGVMRPPANLNATFADGIGRAGNVGFISQSGALLTAVLDWSYRENVGFSAFVSVGSMLDIGWGDLIDYLGDDPHTKSIVIYMESIGDARAFLSAAREVALSSPWDLALAPNGRTLYVAMAGTILYVSPRPFIDVFVFQQEGAAALLRGLNPYQLGFRDLYAASGETLRWYGPGIVHDGRVWAYPYPPLTLLFEAPFLKILGDVRWANVVALAVAAWAIARIHGGVLGEVAAVFLLFQARTFFVLEQAWTEPLVLAAFAASLWLALREPRRVPHWLALGLALGLLLCSNQYSPRLFYKSPSPRDS